MRLQRGEDTATVSHPLPPRSDRSPGGGQASGVLLGLQRTAGNAAVTGQLDAHRTPAGSPMAFVQRCGPTPCTCSSEERADYAEQHPNEPATPDMDGAGPAQGDAH